MGGAEGQVVLVTGGGSGLGRAIVERFYAEGARVVVLDRARRSVESAVEGLGDRVFAVEGDVSRYEDNQRAVSSAVERFGKLDAFIGNAGVFDYGLALADIPERRLDAAFDEVFATNVKGYLFGVRAALPALVRSRGSVVLTLSSASAHAACGGILYTASKHAGVGLVRQLAYELAPQVRVNGVAPGAMRTALSGPSALDLQERRLSDFLPPDEVAARFEPLGRFADAAEHAGAYVLLASRSDANTITGEVLYANGGVAIRGITRPAGGAELNRRWGSEPADDG